MHAFLVLKWKRRKKSTCTRKKKDVNGYPLKVPAVVKLRRSLRGRLLPPPAPSTLYEKVGNALQLLFDAHVRKVAFSKEQQICQAGYSIVSGARNQCIWTGANCSSPPCLFFSRRPHTAVWVPPSSRLGTVGITFGPLHSLRSPFPY